MNICYEWWVAVWFYRIAYKLKLTLYPMMYHDNILVLFVYQDGVLW